MNASQKSRADKRKKELLERKQRKQAQAESSSAAVEPSSGSQSSRLTKQDLSLDPTGYESEESLTFRKKWRGKIFEVLKTLHPHSLDDSASQVARLDLLSSIEQQNIQGEDVQAAHSQLQSIGDWSGDNAAHILSVLRKQLILKYPIELTTREKEGLTSLAETYQSIYPELKLFSNTLLDIQMAGSSDSTEPSPYDRTRRFLNPKTNGMGPVWAERLKQLFTIHQAKAQAGAALLLSYYPASLEIMREFCDSLCSKVLENPRKFRGDEVATFMTNSKVGMNLIDFIFNRDEQDPEIQCLRLRTHIFNTLTGKRPTTEEQAELMTPNLRAEFERRLA